MTQPGGQEEPEQLAIMKIKSKRIRNLRRYLFSLKPKTRVIIGVRSSSVASSSLVAIGFPPGLTAGDSILPSGRGPVSRFNASGGEIVHGDQPMETAYRTVLWHWQDWGGHEHSRFVDVPYQRYPRTPIPPPSVQLTVDTSVHGEQIIVAPVERYDAGNLENLTHVVNLFLELFGECEVFDESLGEIVHAPIRQLNWRLLPPGQHPWASLRTSLAAVIQASRRGNQALVQHRLETINGYGPSFVAIGHGGFHGYVVFGFPSRNLFLLESSFEGNATYVFDERWQTLSQLTKAQILAGHLQTARIIHRASWTAEVARLLKTSSTNNRHAA